MSGPEPHQPAARVFDLGGFSGVAPSTTRERRRAMLLDAVGSAAAVGSRRARVAQVVVLVLAAAPALVVTGLAFVGLLDSVPGPAAYLLAVGLLLLLLVGLQAERLVAGPVRHGYLALLVTRTPSVAGYALSRVAGLVVVAAAGVALPVLALAVGAVRLDGPGAVPGTVASALAAVVIVATGLGAAAALTASLLHRRGMATVVFVLALLALSGVVELAAAGLGGLGAAAVAGLHPLLAAAEVTSSSSPAEQLLTLLVWALVTLACTAGTVARHQRMVR